LRDQSGVNEIKIASGSTAQLRVPIDPSQNAMAQSTVPLWHLNETTGIWKEEGEAVKNGNFFEGNVSHFSVWNCDYQGERADIKGQVVDCNGNPLPNAVVTVNGFMNVTTNSAGIYAAWVPVGFLINCQLLTAFNPALGSNSQVISFVASPGLNNVPTISVPCPAYISGNIISCNGNTLNPATIHVLWAGGGSYLYTTTGNYHIAVPPNASLQIMANYSGNSGSANVSSATIGSTVYAPDILLCGGTSNQFVFSFDLTLNGQTTHYDFIPDSVYCMSYFWENGSVYSMDIWEVGVMMPGNQSAIINFTLDNVPGNYGNLNSPQAYCEIHIGGNLIVSNTGGSSPPHLTTNSLLLQDIGIPNISNTIGTFEYDFSDWPVASGKVTNGYFSIPRCQ